MGGHLCDWFCNSCCLLKDIPRNRPQSCILKMKAIGQKYLSQKRDLYYIYFFPPELLAQANWLGDWKKWNREELMGFTPQCAALKPFLILSKWGVLDQIPVYGPNTVQGRKWFMLIMPARARRRWKQEHPKKHNQIAQGCYFRLPVAQAPCPWERDAAITVISQISCILGVNIKKKSGAR